MKVWTGFLALVLALAAFVEAGDGDVNRGATELSPSRSEYFSWINNTNEGATEAQTIVNLDFFRWLHDQFGMQLDIYAFDAGAIDGKRFYGRVDSERFRRQFPKGFEPLARGPQTYRAAAIDGVEADALAEGSSVRISFDAGSRTPPAPRRLADLRRVDIPHDAEALYEATVFAADNNALEVRSLARSGASRIPQVTEAREAFFGQAVFKARGIWDRNLFDGDPVTAWHARVVVEAAPPGDKLAIAIEGVHGIEGAYASVRFGDRYVGASDRAAAYPSNTWEYVNARRDRGYTYFVTVAEDMVGEEIDVFVLAFDAENLELNPVVWQIHDPVPRSGPILVLD